MFEAEDNANSNPIANLGKNHVPGTTRFKLSQKQKFKFISGIEYYN